MKQPDLYYFEAIKMMSQAYSKFTENILACSPYSQFKGDVASRTENKKKSVTILIL